MPHIPAIYTSVDQLKGVGPAITGKLAKLGIHTQLDLLLHLPLRYEDRTHLTALKSLSPGLECLVAGEVVESHVNSGSRRSLLVTLQDDTGYLTLRFFHFSKRQQNQLRTGMHLRCFGSVRFGPNGLEMVHPEYLTYSPELPIQAETHLTPVYPTTDGLGQGRLRKLVQQSLKIIESWDDSVIEAAFQPISELRKAHNTSEITLSVITMKEALCFLHHPPASATPNDLNMARLRLAFDELVAHFLVLKRRQLALKSKTTLALPPVQHLGKTLLKSLGFKLTHAQRRVTTEILNDLAGTRPMLRLLQGDVGSGKTVIAAFATVRAAENNTQTAIMAPTELLAEQHYLNFSEWLTPLGIRVGILSGRLSEAERRIRLESIRTGETDVVVGTHALFQKEVDFHKLSLVVIDEQHRFGVHQRLSLYAKGNLPHQLVMTATPIPRTLTMSMYADMDLSLIDELPPGRQSVITSVVGDARRQEVIQHLAGACAQGKQAYWVCTLIEDSDHLDFRAAESVYQELKQALPDISIGLVHGRQSGQDKSRIMAEFKSGKVQLLVATTVIEVGVDVPNASLMVIENPERLGLAQLHQLRGRVGRGSQASYCILLYAAPLAENSRVRLNIMRETNDGFRIAEADLELRGPGDLLGTRQTGELTFRVADLLRDADLLPSAKTAAAELMQTAPAVEQVLLGIWSPAQGNYSGV